MDEAQMTETETGTRRRMEMLITPEGHASMIVMLLDRGDSEGRAVAVEQITALAQLADLVKNGVPAMIARTEKIVDLVTPVQSVQDDWTLTDAKSILAGLQVIMSSFGEGGEA